MTAFPALLDMLLTGLVTSLALAGAVLIVRAARRAWRRPVRRDVEGWDYEDWTRGPGA